MRVAHLCLSNFYVDGFGYQENDLVRQHVAAGHDVLVLASTETISASGRLAHLIPSEYLGRDGAKVRRLPYRRWLPHKIMRKLRMNPGVYEALARFRPQTILFHGTCGWELRSAARYVRDNPATLLYVDSHEDWNNSARNFLSREVLHRGFYGPVLRSVMPQVQKILCLSTEIMEFVRTNYRIPEERLELYPIGGLPVADEEYGARREKARAGLAVLADQIMIVQSGKQTRRKKLLESLVAFRATPDPRLRFFIAGVLDDEIETEAQALIDADPRITFLGWQSRDALTDILCAADVYLQPGTQSATMQQSLCCRCAVILDDAPAHKVYQRGNGWFIGGDQSLSAALGELATADLAAMQANSERLARELLDYSILADRVLR